MVSVAEREMGDVSLYGFGGGRLLGRTLGDPERKDLELSPCLACVALVDVVERYGFGSFYGAVYFVLLLWKLGMTLGVDMWLCLMFYDIGGGSGLWRLFAEVESSSPLVFFSRPGGTKSLGILACRNLGMRYVFPP